METIMSGHVFLHESGYYAWAFAAQLKNTKWEAFAIIERKVDHHAVATPCMKHRILAEFETRDDAMFAAAAAALDRMLRHETMIALISHVGNG
jgi:hypothetical protein